MTSEVRSAMGLVVLVLVTWGGALQGTFHYDDFHSLAHNPAVRDVAHVTDFFIDPGLFSVDADKAMYRPVLLTTYALQYALHEYRPVGYLIVNIAIHLACVILFWRLVTCLAPRLAPVQAVAAAALFAVHPVMAEPVNYISSRSESLAALFVLASLLLYVRAVGEPLAGARTITRTITQAGTPAGGRPSARGWWAGALLLFAAGLLTKATAAVVPMLVGLRELIRGPGRGAWRQALLRAAPFAALLVGHLLWLSSRRLLPDDRAEPVRSLGAQLATQVKGVFWYVHLLSMPSHQSVDPAFAVGTWTQPAVWMGLVLLLSVAVLIKRLAWPRYSWWLLWPAVIALPASLIPLNVLVNEHRIYLATAGLCVPVAQLLARTSRGWAWPGIALVALLAILSMQRNAVWQTEKSLWADAVAHAPDAARGRVFLGVALRAEGQLGAAGEQFERAVAAEPTNLAALTNLANIHYELAAAGGAAAVQHLQAAESYYQRVLALDSNHREARTNLGNVYQLRGEPAAAAQQYRMATSSHPDHADAWGNLADVAFDAGDYDTAVMALQHVTRLEPGGAAGFRRLGDALARGGNLAAAGPAYERACRLAPAEAGSCYNLAETLRVRADAAYAAGDAATAMSLRQQALQAYELVLRRAGDYRQARQRVAALRTQISSGGR